VTGPGLPRGRGPLIVAAALGAAMVWLARGPFDAPAKTERVAVPNIVIELPKGVVGSFPRRFSWHPVNGAEYYEITVANESERRTLFRQRGNVAGLDLTIAKEAEPPPGSYLWEVLAVKGGVPVGRGVGRFVVQPDSTAK